MLILEKWNFEVLDITVYKAIYFTSHPLWLFMCCHLCKPIKISLKISIRKSGFSSKTFILFSKQKFNLVNRNKIKLCKFL